MPGAGSALGISSAQVNFMNWFLPLLALAGLIVGGVGLLMQQAFLRWNQGQELRQALITIAISIIAADQMLAHFGGVAEDISWPRTFDKFVDLQVADVQYTFTRLVILGVGLLIGGSVVVLAQAHAHRDGDPGRGVDDRDGLRPRGEHPADVRDRLLHRVGARRHRSVMGGSFASLAPGVDGLWLLNSLVVVIIGGMGSLGGAAVGALLLGLTTNFAAAYLPADYTFYSIIFTFVLLAVVLAIRPALGLFGRPA